MTSAMVLSSSTSRICSGRTTTVSAGAWPGGTWGGAAAGKGSSTTKQVPCPGALSTRMRPPIAALSSWQIARPRPLPP